MRDLTVLISSSVAGGMLLEAVKQPVINGYFIAGSVVGPGGLKLIKAGPSPCAPHAKSCQDTEQSVVQRERPAHQRVWRGR